MPGPPPNPNRQRRNKTSTRAVMEAPSATRIELPTRRSVSSCSVLNELTEVPCALTPKRHLLAGFVAENIQPHDFLGDEYAWHPLTVAWWSTIWDSPMIDEWVDADVPGLVALAALIDAFWHEPTPQLGAEIRFEQREFGLSPLSRRQLQWEIKRLDEKPKVAPVAETPTRARDPRLRLVSKA